MGLQGPGHIGQGSGLLCGIPSCHDHGLRTKGGQLLAVGKDAVFLAVNFRRHIELHMHPSFFLIIAGSESVV